MLTEFKRIHAKVLTNRLYRWYEPERAWPTAFASDRPTGP